ncbi:MAG: hypothetical protein HXY23_07975 [Parvularculaceae bacterium]|nr:hypothetical protein [Parvularculaceae bacterium]
MRSENFEFVSNLDTLAAVVLGALLATAGGLVAEHYEDQIERKRRERDAARFFAEILSSIDQILDFAFESQKYGDPWGSVTMSMFEAANREAKVYERNRERLFDVRDTPLRARIHRHFLWEAFPLEALVELSKEIRGLEDALKGEPDMPASRAERLRARIEERKGARERTLAVLRDERQNTAAICADLARRAEIRLDKSKAAPASRPPAPTS